MWICWFAACFRFPQGRESGCNYWCVALNMHDLFMILCFMYACSPLTAGWPWPTEAFASCSAKQYSTGICCCTYILCLKGEYFWFGVLNCYWTSVLTYQSNMDFLRGPSICTPTSIHHTKIRTTKGSVGHWGTVNYYMYRVQC